jgi:hypothetical protein
MILNTVVALFLFDLCMCALPKEGDFIAACILVISLILFLAEISFGLFCHKHYKWSFFFLLDLIGTASLIPDILELFQTAESATASVDVARAGRAGRLARSASSLRFARFARVFRAVRLIRVARAFRILQGNMHDEDLISTPTPSSRLGIHVSDTIAKRVILMVIILIVIIPYLLVSRESDAMCSWDTILLVLEKIPLPEQQQNLKILMNNFMMKSPDLLSLTVNDIEYPIKSRLEIMNKLRDTELIYQGPNTNTTVCVSIRESVRTEAIFHMLLVVFIVAIFAVGSFVVSKDVHSLVVQPIDRMSSMVRKLAGTVAVLSNDEMGDASLNEAEVIEKVVQRLATIFDVHQDGTAGDGSKKKSKAERMLTGSKTTEIVTRGSIYRIQVTETAPPPQRPVVSQEILQKIDVSNSKISVEEVMDHHPELATMESILRHPKATVFLRAFLAQHFQLENYAFWNECEKFRENVLSQARRIATQYVSDGSLSQVNIDARMRARIEVSLLREEVSNSCFQEPQAEIYKILKQNNHIRFLSSAQCVQYLESKKNHELQQHASHDGTMITDDPSGGNHHIEKVGSGNDLRNHDNDNDSADV